ncbi:MULTISPECIES: GcrA family cell cycle regulator [Methylobacterium]|uniref:GcrA family cell cycle regulator n=1 Tax=Methylobacterium TaxID=407 RepID=UPI0006FCD5A7|nr:MULTISPECIES: GcrA family cell cycle regulator [unclassified Methylobacterium]KQO66594.1 hypothetical protein ASF18_14100 [Methylobacterium sp. Leaf89]
MIKWTPEAKNFVLTLCDTQKLSGSQIADRLAAEHDLVVTKSAVIGVAFRAGRSFSGPRSTACLAAARAARAARVGRTDEQRRRDRERKAAKAATAVPKPASAPKQTPRPAIPAGIPTSLRIPLTQIGEAQCRFIADDPLAGPATCCGHATQHGSPWCPGHYALCTVPVRKAVSLWQPEHRRAA